ncbi:hypothetical protein C7974DRAFT_407434 [Boeremia exigua]|uniref:uncharacterized protein n=1 Tax=Boeremia exigua TaxID=749465 RepID=UPI001E8D8BC2|nr:uncharacterized protein C7974DRAFT_407434 [Boeremia exigua]KAH6643718.1 hypothetical protein C7974DRAFT_407434 [Boeremia exigua]
MAQRAGILWVASDIVAPESLSVEQFDEWYEEDHAPEVFALPGVPAATRYTALLPASSPSTHPPHLITYSFPSLAYAQDPAFLAIAGAEPDRETVGRIYAHAVFDIRFYAELAGSGSGSGDVAAAAAAEEGAATNGARGVASGQTVVASITLSPPSTPSPSPEPQAFETWLTTTLPPLLSPLPSFRNLKQYALVSAAARDRNVMVPRDAPGYLLMATFEVSERDGGEELQRLREGVEGVVGGRAVVGEVGWFGVKRVWG